MKYKLKTYEKEREIENILMHYRIYLQMFIFTSLVFMLFFCFKSCENMPQPAETLKNAIVKAHNKPVETRSRLGCRVMYTQNIEKAKEQIEVLDIEGVTVNIIEIPEFTEEDEKKIKKAQELIKELLG